MICFPLHRVTTGNKRNAENSDCKAFSGHCHLGAEARTIPTTARSLSKNKISRFCSHYPIIPNHLVRQKCTNYPGNEIVIWRSKESKCRPHWLFYVVDGTRTAVKYTKMKIALASRAKLLFFIIKYANL